MANEVKSQKRPTEYQLTVQGLLSAVRDVKDVYLALKSLIGIKLGENEQQGMETLKRHAKKHALIFQNGGKPPARELERTIRLAQNLRDGYEVHFERFLDGSAAYFDRLCGKIRKAASEILERDAVELAAEQEKLRTLLASEAEYAEIAEAYNAHVTHLDRIFNEIGEMEEARAEAKRRERRVESANAVLAELEDL